MTEFTKGVVFTLALLFSVALCVACGYGLAGGFQ